MIRCDGEVKAVGEEWVYAKFFSSEMRTLQHHLDKCVILEDNSLETKKSILTESK